MKKVAWAVLVLIMVIFLINPLSSDARSGYWGGGHWGGGYWGWWAPWAVIGGAAVLAPYYAPYYYAPYYAPYYYHYYDSYYYSPYYAPPPVVIREQPTVYAQPPASPERIFVYPRKGQSEKLQAKDRYECHSWAVSQTHYDPTQPASGTPEVQLNQMRADYKRAMGACLDGRGYTMK